MATFTLKLKDVIELTGGELSFVDGNTVMTGGNIGLQHYPIFDETHRTVLNGKIIDHYMNQEIGVETVDMFQLAMRRRMNEIMPYYNKLYETELIEYDPLSTVDIETDTLSHSETDSEASSSSETETTTDAGSRTVQSDTPQTMLSGNEDYASSAADATSKTVAGGEGSETAQNASTGDTESMSRTKGYQGIPSDLIARFRAEILNIDTMIIGELADCFMTIWNTGDTYTEREGFGYGYII